MMNNERGLVSLISTIIISLLLLIITTSMVALMNSELRQSTDSDQSIRAYYAAEAGAENAIWKIGRGVVDPNGQDCGDPGSSGVISGSLLYTCQRIKFTGPLEGKLNKDEADQFESADAKNMHSLRVSWNTVADGSNTAGLGAVAGFPTGAVWTTLRLPAVMEITMVRYKNNNLSGIGDDCSGNDACIKTFTLRPTISTPYAGARTSYSAMSPGAGPYSASCVTSANNPNTGAYQCTFLITNVSGGFDYVVRYRTRYAGAHYLLTGYTGPNGNGNDVDLDGSSALIDVTAKAGDISRRIVERVRLNSTVANGLDFVIYSDTDISKNCALSVVVGASTDADCKP